MSHTYMKDEAGFCYAWTPPLAALSELTPYDGEVDAGGFATDKAAPAKPAKGKTKKEADPVVDPVVAPAEVDPLDAALAEAKLD